MKKLVVIFVSVLLVSVLYLSLQQKPKSVDKSVELARAAQHKTSNDQAQQPPTGSSIQSSESSGTSSLDSPSAPVDPASTTKKPLTPEMRRALASMLNTSSQGLIEEKTANGYQVDLSGRFQTVPVATINDQGELDIQDYSSLPEGREK